MSTALEESVGLAHGQGAPGQARRWVRSVAENSSDLDSLELLISELVTNAVIHARTDVRLTIRVSADLVRVEVGDGNVLLPMVRAADAAGGRGLRLVDALASRWGFESHVDGKTVWFEIDEPVEA